MCRRDGSLVPQFRHSAESGINEKEPVLIAFPVAYASSLASVPDVFAQGANWPN